MTHIKTETEPTYCLLNMADTTDDMMNKSRQTTGKARCSIDETQVLLSFWEVSSDVSDVCIATYTEAGARVYLAANAKDWELEGVLGEDRQGIIKE